MLRSVPTYLDRWKMFTNKKIELRTTFSEELREVMQSTQSVRDSHPLSPVSVPGHAVEVKMATFMVRFTEHLHFNQVFSSIFTSTCPSYEFLTTLLINLIMEGTLSEINNQFCRQVNKGVLGIVQQYRRDKATAVRKSTSCLDRQSCVHKIEIRRDKTTW